MSNVENIIQTWTRTAIRNDSELVDMCSKSKGVISNKTIIKNHPFVDDPEEEEKHLNKEQEEHNIYGYEDFNNEPTNGS